MKKGEQSTPLDWNSQVVTVFTPEGNHIRFNVFYKTSSLTLEGTDLIGHFSSISPDSPDGPLTVSLSVITDATKRRKIEQAVFELSLPEEQLLWHGFNRTPSEVAERTVKVLGVYRKFFADGVIEEITKTDGLFSDNVFPLVSRMKSKVLYNPLFCVFPGKKDQFKVTQLKVNLKYVPPDTDQAVIEQIHERIVSEKTEIIETDYEQLFLLTAQAEAYKRDKPNVLTTTIKHIMLVLVKTADHNWGWLCRELESKTTLSEVDILDEMIHRLEAHHQKALALSKPFAGGRVSPG